MVSGFPGGTTGPSDVELKTFKDFLLQYNVLTEQCFNSCITDFTKRQVSDKEERCSKNCLEKFLKMSQRLAIRFQEHQALLMGGEQQTDGSGNPPPLIK